MAGYVNENAATNKQLTTVTLPRGVLPHWSKTGKHEAGTTCVLLP